jgi:hypothetical protein
VTAPLGMAGLNDYSKDFQLVQTAHVDLNGSFLVKIECNNEPWEREGGIYAPELVDCVAHSSFVVSPPTSTWYASGYEAMHILRKPSSSIIYVHFIHRPDAIQVRGAS